MNHPKNSRRGFFSALALAPAALLLPSVGDPQGGGGPNERATSRTKEEEWASALEEWSLEEHARLQEWAAELRGQSEWAAAAHENERARLAAWEENLHRREKQREEREKEERGKEENV